MTPEALKALEGQEVGISSWYEITQDMIDRFADVTFDPQFIHIDPVRAAAETPFGGTIAHGFLTLSLLSAMGYEAIPPLDGAAMGVNYGMNRMRFLAPVPAGAKVRGRFVLKDMREDRVGEITCTWDVTVEMEGAAKPALIAEWINRRYLGEEA